MPHLNRKFHNVKKKNIDVSVAHFLILRLFLKSALQASELIFFYLHSENSKLFKLFSMMSALFTIIDIDL